MTESSSENVPVKRRSPAHPISRATASEKARQAIELRIKGHTLHEIAQIVGYKDKSNAGQAIKRGLMQSLREPAEQLRELENQRLDQLRLSLWPIAHGKPGKANTAPDGQPSNEVFAVAPDNMAALRLLQISDRQSRLNGLDEPFEVSVMGTHEFVGNLEKAFPGGGNESLLNGDSE